MAIGTGMAEDMNGMKEDGSGRGLAAYGMMATGTRQSVDGDGTAVIGRTMADAMRESRDFICKLQIHFQELLK